MSERRRAPLVTIADLYETGGSVIGPRVAERLEVPLLDLVIPEEPTRRAGVSEDAVADGYEEPRGVDRLFSVAACATTVTRSQTSTPGDLDHQERRLRGAIEEALAETTRSDGGGDRTGAPMTSRVWTRSCITSCGTRRRCPWTRASS